MKQALFIISILFTTLFAIGQEESTEVKIKKSTDKVKIEGKYYYIHIVRKGETLYSISKAYNVSQIEIAMENPDIYLGVQIDQALKIPIKDSVEDIPSGNEDENFIYHVVRKGETLFGLSRKYKISMEEIIRVNPEVETGLKLSQVVLIPKEKVQTLGDAKPEESERFYYHEVRPREGFYSLTRQYGVSEETIRRFNTDLVKDGLKLGTILRIPKDPKDTLDVRHHNAAIADTKTPSESVNTKVAVCDTFKYNPKHDVFNVALMLPLYVYEFENPPIDSAALELQTRSGKTDKTLKVPNKSANFIDFYQGVLLALDTLKKQGISVNLSVYDTNKDADQVKKIIMDRELENADLIIGPVYPECLKPVADYGRIHQIPVISPLSPNNYLLNDNPFLFQANPSFIAQLEEFTSVIDVCSDQNLVMIHEADSTANNMVETYKDLIKKRISSCQHPDFVHFKEVTYKPGSLASEIVEIISHSLIQEKENIILVPSNNEAFVADLLGNLFTLSTYYTYPISVYGLPRWQRFRNVQVDYYYQLQLHLFTPFFVDYTKPAVKDFITKYRDFYRAEPNQYSYQGYDVVSYFVTALKSYGPDFRECIHNHKSDLLQSEYSFEKINVSSGFENRSVYLIEYTKAFEIKKVDIKVKPIVE